MARNKHNTRIDGDQADSGAGSDDQPSGGAGPGGHRCSRRAWFVPGGQPQEDRERPWAGHTRPESPVNTGSSNLQASSADST